MFKRGRATKWADSSLRCSFCGQPQAEVETLINGPGVRICNKCIGLCNDIIDKERAPSR